MKMVRYAVFMVLALVCLGPGVALGAISMDGAGATNMLDSVTGILTYGGGIMLPIVLGLVGIGAALGIYHWGRRKAGVKG